MKIFVFILKVQNYNRYHKNSFLQKLKKYFFLIFWFWTWRNKWKRRKFALRSRGLPPEESETDSSWKKKNKNKVGNFFKWFKKERMEEEEEEYERSRESDLYPPLERGNQLFSSSKPKPRSLRNVYNKQFNLLSFKKNSS